MKFKSTPDTSRGISTVYLSEDSLNRAIITFLVSTNYSTFYGSTVTCPILMLDEILTR